MDKDKNIQQKSEIRKNNNNKSFALSDLWCSTQKKVGQNF